MPVLNRSTLLSRDFDDYKLMPNHNDFKGMIDEMEFPDGEPHYYFPEPGRDSPSVHAVRCRSAAHLRGARRVEGHGRFARHFGKQFFEPGQMEMLRLQQIKCVEYIDGQIGRLMAMTPPETHFISYHRDHGELFGGTATSATGR